MSVAGAKNKISKKIKVSLMEPGFSYVYQT